MTKNYVSDQIYFSKPGPLAAALPYRALVGGETLVGRVTPQVTQRFHQHVLVQTLRGCGQVRHGSQTHAVPAGSLAWLDTALDYSHGCHLDEGFWHYRWIGIEGYRLDQLFQGLDVAANPIFAVQDSGDWISKVVHLLTIQEAAQDALISAHISTCLASLAQQRKPGPQDGAGRRIAQLMSAMRADLAYPWRVDGLALQTGLSTAQLFRHFRQVAGTTPMAWLRDERMVLAKRLVVETDAQIASIGQRCGYADPYHFSRDFKRLAGLSPRGFRKAQGR